jgi:hypothetical protein
MSNVQELCGCCCKRDVCRYYPAYPRPPIKICRYYKRGKATITQKECLRKNGEV